MSSNGQQGLVALVGATGAIGASVAVALRKAGRRYRAIGRSRDSLEKAFGDDPLAEIAVWDPDDAQSTRQVLRGAETIVYLVGVPYTQFELHPILMRRVVDAAVAEKVDRLLLVATLYPFGRARAPRITEDHPREPHTFKGKKRKEQEDVVLEAHASGKIRTTILRSPDFYGPGVDRSLIADLFVAAKKGRRAKLLGPIDRPHEFVFVPDVGPVVVRLLDTPGAFGRTWNLGGAGVTSQLELARMAYGGKPRVMAAGKTMLRVMGLFSPMMREFVEMSYLMTDPLIVDDSALKGLLGEIHKTPYADGVRRCLDAVR